MTGKITKAHKKEYRKPVRMFEDSGTVSPQKAYYTRLDNVTNTRLLEMHQPANSSVYIPDILLLNQPVALWFY